MKKRWTCRLQSCVLPHTHFGLVLQVVVVFRGILNVGVDLLHDILLQRQTGLSTIMRKATSTWEEARSRQEASPLCYLRWRKARSSSHKYHATAAACILLGVWLLKACVPRSYGLRLLNSEQFGTPLQEGITDLQAFKKLTTCSITELLCSKWWRGPNCGANLILDPPSPPPPTHKPYLEALTPEH